MVSDSTVAMMASYKCPYTAHSDVLQLGLRIKSHNTENFVLTFFLFFFLLNSFSQGDFGASLETGNVWDDFPCYQKALI